VLRIYTDESVPVAVAEGLRRRGIEAWSARDASKLGMSDEEQLNYACQQKAVIFTHDADFLKIAHQWVKQGREHWGVIYAPQRKFSIGECIRRLLLYALVMEPEDMRNRIEFL